MSHALSVAANFSRLPHTIVNPGCMYTSKLTAIHALTSTGSPLNDLWHFPQT
ncbi:MAG: hypothetical protein NTV55_10455 [Planctomycetota bacterium]|nr:hypothetical protein [Planctomycetota bacterium]